MAALVGPVRVAALDLGELDLPRAVDVGADQDGLDLGWKEKT